MSDPKSSAPQTEAPQTKAPALPNFTAEEKALLAPYVTSTEKPVFVLTNLPEVIKGALFSRYSRSTLGLRELLLKEFIQDKEAAFEEIGALANTARQSDTTQVASAPQAASAAHLAVERAQSFYDRILDGYGDDSIGELGGAHLALESVSMIATKVLEDARIGGSPLEKSTRYVSFAQKVGGDYLFYKEPTLMASAHRERYLQANRTLFETYAALIPPLTDYIKGEVPKPEAIKPGAWERSVRARVFDDLRGLLPASTLTNMGIFGNGRFFETLIGNLHLSPLAELNTLAREMTGELAKVIPSFIRRARTDHPHFGGFRDYQHALQQAMEALPAKLVASGDSASADPREVELVAHDPHAPRQMLAALAYPHAEAPWQGLRQATDGMDEAALSGVFQQLADLRQNRRHKPPRALELGFYTFDLLGDYGMYRDMHRHRMLTQQRQPLTTRHGYQMPEEVRDAGLEGPYRQAMEQAAEAFEAIAADHPLHAQYVVPMAYRIRWHMHINLRALIWMTELRSSPQGHPAYRRMAQQMYQRVAEAQPFLAPLFKFIDLEDYPLGRLGAEQRTEEKAEGK